MADFTAYTTAEDEGEYLKQSVEIIPEAIQEEFVRVPVDLAYWGERYAEAVKEFLTAEHERKTLYATLRLQVRELAASKGEKLTEKDCDAWVEQTPKFQQAKLAEIEAEAAKIAAKARLDAVTAKRDMCMSLGAHIRAEMSPGHLNRRND